MIQVMIVDDEPLALDIMESYVEQLPSLKLKAKCTNAIEAMEILKKESIDLLFLDIQMPQLTGIELVKSLKKPPLVVFTTAYPNYAAEGFDLDAVDYLLKPISKDRFLRAVQKAEEMLQIKNHDDHSEETDFMFVKADKKLIKMHYQDILYIEGLKDYVIIKTNEGRVITLQTMKSLEEKLPKQYFQRIHRSYIVGITKVKAVVGNSIEIKENKQTKHLPIGKNYRDDILEIINKNRL